MPSALSFAKRSSPREAQLARDSTHEAPKSGVLVAPPLVSIGLRKILTHACLPSRPQGGRASKQGSMYNCYTPRVARSDEAAAAAPANAEGDAKVSGAKPRVWPPFFFSVAAIAGMMGGLGSIITVVVK